MMFMSILEIFLRTETFLGVECDLWLGNYISRGKDMTKNGFECGIWGNYRCADALKPLASF